MPREKKDARYLNIKLASKVYDQLDRFCAETGVNKTIATEKIMERFFKEYFDKPEEERGLFKKKKKNLRIIKTRGNKND